MQLVVFYTFKAITYLIPLNPLKKLQQFNYVYQNVRFGNTSFNGNHVVMDVLGQFLEGAHLRFPVSGRQIRNDTRIVGVDDDNCDEAPSEGQNTNRTAHPCVTVSYFNN